MSSSSSTPTPSSSSSSILPRLSPAEKDLISGTTAGIVSVLVCHPLDTIRVRLQTAPPGRFHGVFDVVRQTIKFEGPRALYKGITAPLVAQGLQKATMFYAYGISTRTFLDWNKSNGINSTMQTLPLWQIFLSGSVAGIANALVANPFELVRNRLQVQYQRHLSTALYKGPLDCARQIVAHAGVKSLWLGVVPMMIRDAPGVGAWYATFQGVRRLLVPAGELPSQTPAWKTLLAGACGGIGFWLTAFPQDTIKNVIQTRGMSMALDHAAATSSSSNTSPSSSSSSSSSSSISQKRLGFFATGAELVREQGWRRLWKGFPIAALRGIPGAGSTFLSYQLAMNAIEKYQL